MVFGINGDFEGKSYATPRHSCKNDRNMIINGDVQFHMTECYNGFKFSLAR